MLSSDLHRKTNTLHGLAARSFSRKRSVSTYEPPKDVPETARKVQIKNLPAWLSGVYDTNKIAEAWRETLRGGFIIYYLRDTDSDLHKVG